jgi:hypothetical protein
VRPRSQRIANTDRAIARQLAIRRHLTATSRDCPDRKAEQPHRLAKHHWSNCGTKGCMYCQNPRRRGELTMQERRLKPVVAEPLDL